MSKLFRSGIRRYTHSIIFWLVVAVNIGAAIIGGYEARRFYFDDFYFTIALIANTVMISWLVGREYEEGIFRNKVVSGHSKGSIYLSELILGVGACIILYLLFVLIFLCFNHYIIGYAPVDVSLKVFVGGFLASACTAAILVTVSALIPHRAITGIVNILLVFAMVLVTNSLQGELGAPEYWEDYEYEEVSYIGEDGNTHFSLEPIEGSEYLVKNERYIDGPLRNVLQFTYRIFPYTNITEGTSITNYWFGYEQVSIINNIEGTDLTWAEQVDFTITDEENHDLAINLIFTAVELMVICGIGYFCFRKKELK